MRIISGKLGGRIFQSPSGNRTHPMSDKIRGAIFGVLGDITGLSILDTFSGSGALALEAISRGAASVTAIDVDKKAYSTIVNNVESLGIAQQIKVVKSYFNAWSTRHQNLKFNIIIADPPYNDIPYRDMKKIPRHLTNDGIIVLSWPKEADAYYWPDMVNVVSKKYGDAQLLFYRKIS